ncbi:MAG: hypothetical protein MUE96_03285 [Bacteroidia bacterium]|jgi:hypothetical protein|nr:hypothetical protein [Bacteroidia bacterium]
MIFKTILEGLEDFEDTYEPQTDKSLNIHLLEEAKTIIEVTWFSKYLAGFVSIILEICSYLLFVGLFITASYLVFWINDYYSKILMLSSSLPSEWHDLVEPLRTIAFGIYIISFLPSVLMLLIAIGFTRKRNRVKKLITADKKITSVILNLKYQQVKH